MTALDYFDRKEVSNSMLSKLWEYLNGSERPEPFNAYRLGTLCDLMITEPERVDFIRLEAGGYTYTQEEFDNTVKMKRAFFADPLCKKLFENSTCQKVMIRKDQPFQYGGLKFTLYTRCKWDLWMDAWKWGGDIKSTTATTQKQFEAACKMFDYDRQRAWYMDIAESEQDILIGISRVTKQIFKLPIKRGDVFYTSGKQKYEYLAFQYFKLYG